MPNADVSDITTNGITGQMENSMKNKLQNQINEDALLREVVEDVKNEQLQQIWNKYGLFIIIGIALILTATVSFESFRNWQARKSQELSNAYSIALSLQNQGRWDESLEIYNALAEKASGIYADIAKMQIANVYLEQDRKDDAAVVLQALIDDKAALPQIKEIAALKLASYKLDNNAPANEVSGLLTPLIQDSESADIARELLAMLYIREKNMDQAQAEYQKIASSATASDSLKARALDMINLLSEIN